MSDRKRIKSILRSVACKHGLGSGDRLLSGDAKYRDARSEALDRLLDEGYSMSECSRALGMNVYVVMRRMRCRK